MELLYVFGIVVTFILFIYFLCKVGVIKITDPEMIELRNAREDMLKSREELSPTDFYEIYYSNSKLERSIVLDILNVFFNNYFDFPVGKIRPEDTFKDPPFIIKKFKRSVSYGPMESELEYFWLETEMNISDIREQINSNEWKEIESIYESIRSVDDYIRFMVKLNELKNNIIVISNSSAMKNNCI